MAFDFIDFFTGGGNNTEEGLLNNVVYTSIILTIIIVIIICLLLYKSLSASTNIYFKLFFYIFLATLCILSVHYNSLYDDLNHKCQNRQVANLLDEGVGIPDDILGAKVPLPPPPPPPQINKYVK
jgi:hypothetical protein